MLKIGHRGAKAYAPENTLDSFRKAAAMGVDMVEVDIRLTKDKHPVAIHDARVKRLTESYGTVRSLTLKQVKKLKVFKSEPIPTLAEVLEVVNGSIGLNIELKVKGSAEVVVQTLRDFKVDMRNIMISSNYPNEIRAVEALEPKIVTAVILRAPNGFSFWYVFDALAVLFFPITKYYMLWVVRHARADYINLHRLLFSRKKVMFFKKHGIKTCAWTVDSPKQIAHLKSLGVDGIITNYPDRL